MNQQTQTNIFEYVEDSIVDTIRPISRKECEPFILGIHYAKRFPSITYAFGMFEQNELIGIVTYGTPPSSTLRKGVAGDNYIDKILELNRLVLKYNRKNEASKLISKSLKMLPESIVVSFADIAQGHVGYVYQACNFMYTGLSAKRTDWKIKGKEHLHGQTIADEFRGIENRAKAIRQKYGDDFYLKERSRKHRYVYIVGSKRFKKKALKSLKYDIMNYPK
jgi:hypothetical protein